MLHLDLHLVLQALETRTRRQLQFPVSMPSKLIPQRLLDTDDTAFRPESRSSDFQNNKNKAAPIQNSSTAVKRTTANSNNVAVARISAPAPDAKAKKSKKDDPEPAMGLQDEDDSQEEEAALASPLKGSESRKMNKVSRHIFSSLSNANSFLDKGQG
jgi:hypothetical protein